MTEVKQARPNRTKLFLAFGGGLFLMLCLCLVVFAVIGNSSKDNTKSKPYVITQVKDTATPKPTATKTPVPTETPVPATATPVPPKPSATPGYTATEGEYLVVILKQMELMGPSLKRTSELVSNPRLSDINWKVDLALEFTKWQMTYKEAKTLKPSSRFQNFHKTYLAALANFDGAATDVATGIDNLDAKRIEAGAVKMKEGARLLGEATVLFDKGKI